MKLLAALQGLALLLLNWQDQSAHWWCDMHHVHPFREELLLQLLQWAAGEGVNTPNLTIDKVTMLRYGFVFDYARMICRRSSRRLLWLCASCACRVLGGAQKAKASESTTVYQSPFFGTLCSLTSPIQGPIMHSLPTKHTIIGFYYSSCSLRMQVW